MLNYNVIAYKPDGSTRCGDRWESDFEHLFTVSRKQAINTIADFYYTNMNLSRSEPDWDIQLLINGVPEDRFERDNWKDPRLYQMIWKRAKKIAEGKKQKLVEEEQAKKEVQVKAEKQKQIDKDLQKLKELKLQYGDIS